MLLDQDLSLAVHRTRRRPPGRRGSSSSYTVSLARSRSLIVLDELVDAVTGRRAAAATDPGWSRARRSASAGQRSVLLNTKSSGTSPAPISDSTRRTASMLPSGSAAPASTTCTSRSASTTTSSVLLNASTSWWGSLRTKPTVSVSSTVSPPGSLQPSGGGVEGREQAVLDEDAGVGQPVQQGRLAGVRVADDGDATQAAIGGGPCAGSPGAGPDVAQLALELVDPPHAGGADRPRAGSRRGHGCRCRRPAGCSDPPRPRSRGRR